jgi:hypothetical protein
MLTPVELQFTASSAVPLSKGEVCTLMYNYKQLSILAALLRTTDVPLLTATILGL